MYMEGIVKKLFVTTIAIIGLLAAGAAATQGDSQDVEAGCRAACESSRAEMCEPAQEAVREGRLTEAAAAEICRCGVSVCANVCACESTGERPCRRTVSAECERLGAGMPE